MAFQTGSQINPALGAINYTPYMQGAVAGAQSIGQGIANLGQGIASGIEGYYKKKEEKAQLDQATGVVSNLIKTDPQLARYIGLTPNEKGEFDQKAIAAGVKAVGAGPIIQLAQNLQAQSAAKESDARVAQYILGKQKELEANQGLGATPEGMVAGPTYQATPVPRLTAVEELAGQKSLLEMQIAEANRQKTLAEAGAAGVAKPTEIVFNTSEAARAAGVAANPGAQVLVEPAKNGGYTFKAQQALPQQVVSPEDELRIKTFGTEIQNLLQSGQTARQLAPQVNTLLSGLETGKLKTGKFEDLKLEARALGKALGVGVDEEALANAQTAKAMFGRMVLEYFQQTKGSISNAENQLFASFGPQLGTSEEANKAILKMAQKRMTLDRAQEKIARDFASGKINAAKAQTSIQENLDKYDQEIAGLLPNQGGSQPAAGGGNLIQLSPSALQYIQ